MKLTVTMLSGVALAFATPSFAQAQMSPTDVGASPMTGTSATDYVKLAADGDMYEIQSSKLALTKSKRADVKGFAKQMIADHTKTTQSLKAALVNQDRKIAPPPMMLSSANQSKIDLLRKAPKGTFDQLYLQQQLQAHQMAWSLHDGYATDGQDPQLKQVAATAVPIIEQHLSMVKGMAGAATGQPM
jgi:putative membrane protein